jgi:hypothetical protein
MRLKRRNKSSGAIMDTPPPHQMKHNRPSSSGGAKAPGNTPTSCDQKLLEATMIRLFQFECYVLSRSAALYFESDGVSGFEAI